MTAYSSLLALSMLIVPVGRMDDTHQTLGSANTAAYGPTAIASFPLSQQPNPNEERFLQESPDKFSIDDPSSASPETENELLRQPPDEVIDPATDPLIDPAVVFVVQRIDVGGSRVFDDADLRPIVAPLEGRPITLEDLREAAAAITQLYLDEGYLTSRAIVPNQIITDETARIQIIEGRISDILIEGNKRLRQSYIRRRIQLGLGTPLRTRRLEDQLRLLRANPQIDEIEASLRAGEAIGESILVVQVVEADPWIGSVWVDNYSPPSVGSERIGAELAYLNLSGWGDSLFASVDRTTQGGSTLVEAEYTIPLNPMDGTLQLRSLINRNEIISGPFVGLDIEGESELYEISLRQPVVRTPREEFALSVGFSHRDGQTLISGEALPNFAARTSIFRFGQDYIKRDRQGAWALRSQLSIGTGLFDATVDDSDPDSRFFSWLAQAQRLQRLDQNQVLVLQLDLQLTPDPLLSSEQFVIGGGQSLRGFRQNVRSGDNGVRLSVENRITLARNEAGLATFQLSPFIDTGAVWNSSGSAELPNQCFLAGVGLGALWEVVPDVTFRLDIAVPLVDLDDRGENAQDEGVYFSVRYRI